MMDAQDLSSDQQENSGQRNAGCQFLPVQLCFKTHGEASFRKRITRGIQQKKKKKKNSFNFFLYTIRLQFNCQSSQKVQEGGRPHPSPGPSQFLLPVSLLRFPRSAFQSHPPQTRAPSQPPWSSAAALWPPTGKKLKLHSSAPTAPHGLLGSPDAVQGLGEQGREQHYTAFLSWRHFLLTSTHTQLLLLHLKHRRCQLVTQTACRAHVPTRLFFSVGIYLQEHRGPANTAPLL